MVSYETDVSKRLSYVFISKSQLLTVFNNSCTIKFCTVLINGHSISNVFLFTSGATYFLFTK